MAKLAMVRLSSVLLLLVARHLLLLVRHLLLVAWHLFLIANIVTTSEALVPSSVLLLLVARPFVPSSVHVPSSDARSP